MTLTTRTKQWCVLALLTAATTVAGAGYVLVQVRSQGAALAANIARVNEEAARTAARARVERLIEETIGAREQLAKMFLTSDSASIDVLTMLEARAPAMGVSLSELTIDVVTEKVTGKKTEIRLPFTYTGTKDRVFAFTRYIEAMPYHSKVTGLSLSDTGGEWQGEAEVRLTIVQP
jgi:alpha-glucuronidase